MIHSAEHILSLFTWKALDYNPDKNVMGLRERPGDGRMEVCFQDSECKHGLLAIQPSVVSIWL